MSKMDWFREAKYGLFIHWGIYAIPGGEWKGAPSPHGSEWIMKNMKIPYAEYKELDRSSLYVAEVYANQGPTLKRYWARSHGRADMIKKHTSHITIVLDQK